MDEPTEAEINETEPHLPCSLCERDCWGEEVQIMVGMVVVQVACPACAMRFRHLLKLCLAAARQLGRRARELDGQDDEEKTE